MITQTPPRTNSTWTSSTTYGLRYTVVCVTNMKNSDFAAQVVLVDPDGDHWSLPLSRWPGHLVPTTLSPDPETAVQNDY